MEANHEMQAECEKKDVVSLLEEHSGKKEIQEKKSDCVGELPWDTTEQALSGKGAATENDKGFTTIELALIIVIVVGLLIIFKNQLTEIMESVFSKVTTAVNQL